MVKGSGGKKKTSEAIVPEIVDPMNQIVTKVETSEEGTSITISSAREYSLAVEAIKNQRALKKEIESFFNDPDPTTGVKDAKGMWMSLKQAAAAPWRALCAKENELVAKVSDRIERLDKAIVAYDDERQREAEALKLRLEAEARAQEEARRKEEVKALKAAGEKEAAKELQRQPIETPAIHTEAVTPRVGGLHFTAPAKGYVENAMELLCAITRATIYREVAAAFKAQAAKPENEKHRESLVATSKFLERGAAKTFSSATPALVEFKQAELNRLISSLGGDENVKIPGVKIVVEKKSVTR